MGEFPEVPERVKALVCAALDHAVYYLKRSPQLLAMLIVETDDEPVMPLRSSSPQPGNRGWLPVLAEAPEALRERVVEGRGGLEAYAIIYDGFLSRPDGGEKVDAVFIEAGAEGEGSSWIFAQSYRPKGLFRRFREIGDLKLVETTRSLLCFDP